MEEGQDQQSNTTKGSDSRNAFHNAGELRQINPTTLEPEPPGSRLLNTPPLPQTIGKPNVNFTKPQGFGLHLNSLVNFVPDGATLSMKSKESGSVSIPSKSSSKIRFLSSESSRSCPVSCNEEKQLLETIKNDKIEKDQAFAATSEAVIFPYCTKQAELESWNILESNPFDTVKDTNQQIGSPNPIAFAPTIIQHATEASTKRSMEDGILSSSATRKRGCRCQKTMCLKRSCACYKATAGCSAGCRCNGCQNVFGKKKEYVNEKHPSRPYINELYDVSSGGNVQEVASTDGTLFTQQFSPHELTPQTSSFQYSNDGKDGSKSCIPSGRYLPFPESSDVEDYNLISHGPSENVSNHGIVKDVAPLHQELDDGSLFAAPEFSPTYRSRGGPGI